MIARQSTAFEIAIGPVLDADGVAVTDCVIGDFKIKKTTGNFAALNGSATLAHVSAGMYDLVGTTSDSDTVGFLTIAIDDTVNACAPVRMQVVEEAVYDAMYAASAPGYVANAPVNVAQLGGDTQSLTDLKDFADVGYDPSTNKVQGLVLADAVTTVNGMAADTITATSIAANAITAAKIATGAIDADALAADAVDEIWDEVMVGTLTARSALSVASSGGLGAFSVNDAGASTTAFVTDLTSSVDDFYRDMQIQFTSGALAGQIRIVSDYVGSTKTVTLDEALTSAPANGVTFVLSGPHTHTVSSIADSVWASATRVLTAGTNIQLPSNGLANVTAWTVNLTGSLSGNVGGIAGTTNTFDALQTALNSAHGSGSWATATGFSTHSASDVWAVATRVLTAGTNIQLPSNGLANVTSWTVGITGNITGNLSGSVGSVTGLTTATIASAVHTTAMTESYSTDGSAATLAQAIYVMMQMMTEISFSGTTGTVKKLDGSTTAYTLTINDASTPTSVTRSS